jgi:hypothetical protein
MPNSEIIYPSWIEKVKNFDEFKKLSIYMNYYCTMLSLKHDFYVVDKNFKPNGLGTPDKEFLGIEFRWLHKNLQIPSFDEFISDKNIDLRDCGENWEERGFARRYWIQPSGIYDWCFKNQIKFN